MSYKAPTPGRFDARQNTTDYVHPQETNLLSIERAMQYRNDGSPELRVNSTFSGNVVNVYGNGSNIDGIIYTKQKIIELARSFRLGSAT